MGWEYRRWLSGGGRGGGGVGYGDWGLMEGVESWWDGDGEGYLISEMDEKGDCIVLPHGLVV